MPGKPRRPSGLGSRAVRFWDQIVATYDLRPDEVLVLENACREIDLITRMEAEQRDAGLISEGYNGQPVPAPMLGELRQHRSVLARLLGQLKFPDAPDQPAETASEQARRAAFARWNRQPS